MPTNIELKSRLDDMDAAENALRVAGARFEATLVQTDTYFHVPIGRLKLRQVPGRPAELIGYHRADDANLRDSHYQVTPIAEADAPGLLASLGATLRVRVVVDKTRKLWMYQTVRIHLDDVRNLGTFVEIESLVLPGLQHYKAATIARHVWELLPVRPDQRVTGSYSDLFVATK